MDKHPADVFSMVADVGGTNTRVALTLGQTLLPKTIRKYRNSEFTDLEQVLGRFISDENSVDCTSACVALAGPVRDGVGEMTNLDWRIDNTGLANATGAEKVFILNDLQAQGLALGHIEKCNISSVLSGKNSNASSPMLAIGVGTGFNAAPVIDTSYGRLVSPSECGHVGLPVRTESDQNMYRYLKSKVGHPAIEDVLSGRGVENVYDWLGHQAGDARHLSAGEIMQAVGDGTDPRAHETAKILVRYLGIVVGNLSLIHLPFGGVYLIGGVARALKPYFMEFGFDDAFHDKGKFSDFMDNFEVSVVEDDFAALVGCAHHLNALS